MILSYIFHALFFILIRLPDEQKAPFPFTMQSCCFPRTANAKTVKIIAKSNNYSSKKTLCLKVLTLIVRPTCSLHYKEKLLLRPEVKNTFGNN